MSTPSPEPSRNPIRRIGERVSRWQNTRRGTKTLKAAYAQAARDVKRMDPAVRERIGRANMTKADLQVLAQAHVAGEFSPEHRRVGQMLNDRVAARVQEAGASAAPTRNPIPRLSNRMSRWRNTRQGTKALKAAYAQAARDVKRMDPAVRQSIGRAGMTKSDLQFLAQSRMEQAFRPEGRLGALPGQQQAQQQGQPRVQADSRAAQLEAQVAALESQVGQLRSQVAEGQHNVGFHPVVPTQQPEAQQPQADGQQPEVSAQQPEAQQPQAQTRAQRAEVNQAWVNAASGQGQRSPAGQQSPAANRQDVTGQQPAARQADVQQMVAANQQWAATHGTGQQSAGNQADVKGGLSKTFDAAFSGTAQPSASADGQAGRAADSPGDGARQRTTTTSAKRDGQSTGL
jgi:hypothetical protein